MSSALLIVGSPKPRSSASRTVGEALLSRMTDLGWDTEVTRVPLRDPDGSRTAEVLATADAADLVVLSCPVYVDTLPAPVTALLERWQDARRDGTPRGCPRLAFITQCGFPETIHTAPAVTAARLFAESSALPWAGAIAFGMGGMVEGAGVERGPFARSAAALDTAAEALAAGHVIPAEVGEVFAHPALPKALYLTAAGFAWRIQARRNKCDAPLRTRRYACREARE